MIRRCRPRIVLAILLSLLAPASLAWAQDGIREEVQKPPEPKLTKPPKLLKFVPAQYPESAREAQLEGSVELLMELDSQGKVSKVDVVSSPDPALSKAAVEAARQFAFSPAEVDNKPAPIRIRYAYNFVLEIAFSPRLPSWMDDRKSVPAGSDLLVGRVRERGTRLPLPGTAVVIRSLGQELKADHSGTFSFAGLSPGQYKVEAISQQHNKQVVDVEIVAGEQTRITFYLHSKVKNPYETVVRGKRRQTTVTRVTLRQKELTTVPGTFGDPFRVVENLPGVARLPFMGGALLIRGASPDDSMVLLDGAKIPQLYHFMGGPSVLHPEFLDRIDFYSGNADVRFGRLIAGVVDATTRNTFTEQWGGSLDVNMMWASLMLKIPLTEKVSISAAIRRSYMDALMGSMMDASGENTTMVLPVFYDYQVRVDVKLKKDNQFYVLIFGSDDAMEMVSNEPDEDYGFSVDTNLIFHRIMAGWRWQISDRVFSRLTPSVGYAYEKWKISEMDVNMKTLGFLVREDLEIKVNKRLTARTGLDINVEYNWFDAVVPMPADYRNPASSRIIELSDEKLVFDIDQVQFGLGLYLDGILNITDKLQVIPGVRMDIFRYFGNTRLSVDPRATMRYKLFKLTTIKGGVGMFSNTPNELEVNEHYGNPNLVLQHAVQTSLGFEQRFPWIDALSLDIQGFFIWRYDLAIPSKDMVITDDSILPLRYTNEGEGCSAGMELLLKHDITKRFYGWLAYTLSVTKAQRKADGPFIHYFFDQTHILTLVASYRLPWGIEAGIRFRLVSGRPDTPVLGSIFDNDMNRYFAITGERDDERLPLFHQLDFRVEKTWIYNLWRLSLYLDIQNLYYAKNAEAIFWDYRYGKSAILEGMPIMPTLGIKGSF